MKTMTLIIAALALVPLTACNADKGGNKGAAAAGPVKAVPPPKGGDWTQLVSATRDGGFLMGNPAAKVKLVEYGSMTCPHCADFAAKGEPALLRNYVKSGKVSFEFRNFVRDPFDITASLIARCGGAKPFFGLTQALYTTQKDWIGRIQTAPPAQMQALQSQPPAVQFRTIAKLAGLDQWAAQRGLPSAKSSACLANEGEINRLVQINSDAVAQYNIPGTPGFLINGALVEDAASWEVLEPKLKAALAG